METKFLKYTARDRKTKEILFKSRMDDENVLYLRKNENYNILKDKVVFFLSRGCRDMTFTFNKRDIEKIWNNLQKRIRDACYYKRRIY